MGRRKKESHSWMSRTDAHAEVLDVLGGRLGTVAMQGMHPILQRRKQQADARAWKNLRRAVKSVGPKARAADAALKAMSVFEMLESESGQRLFVAMGEGPSGIRPSEFVQFVRFFKLWRDMTRYVSMFARRIDPEAWIRSGLRSEVDATATRTISDYFAALEHHSQITFTGR